MTDLIGVAAIISALLAPIALIFVAVINRKVTQIDHAVNGKVKGAQSMVSQVDDMHRGDFPPEVINDAALLPLVRLLVEDMKQRRSNGD